MLLALTELCIVIVSYADPPPRYEGWRTSRLKRTPQRIRQAGGVTPVAVVPREGRSSSGAGHELTPIATPTHRAVSAGKAEKVLGTSSAEKGLYRGLTAYQ